ncbi:MAG: SCP2 sterol-binding domain-containing protein [Deltaproteobacteria bacterium]|nr:SCP2 sterol-binding domain-containing protein [Deltaproteobacteria bacterium]
MTPQIDLAPGTEANGMAMMIADLVRQNLELKPHKCADFESLTGTVAIVAEDAEVALTIRFEHGHAVVHDGIVGIPDVTIRGDSESVLTMSNLPIHPYFNAPVVLPGDREGWAVLRGMLSSLLSRKLRIQGAILHLPLMLRLARVMSVNG